jgi:hypothetical protein
VYDGDKFVAQLSGLPFDFRFQPILSLVVSGGPDGFVIFDLVLDHGVKDQSDLVGGSHGCALGPSLVFIRRRKLPSGVGLWWREKAARRNKWPALFLILRAPAIALSRR